MERATSCLVALAAFAMPKVSLIDGFNATEGEGPRHGRRVPLGTIIAGTDAVAVDAVAAAIMGFEPMEIAYLRLAQATGLGTADLPAITIVGDPISRPRRFRRHPADPLLRLAGAGSSLSRGAPASALRNRPRSPPRANRGTETDRCALAMTVLACPTAAASAASPASCSRLWRTAPGGAPARGDHRPALG